MPVGYLFSLLFIECEAYGSTYIEYSNMDLDVPNSVEFSDITQEDCRVRCEQNGCRGYNYSAYYKKCKIRQQTPLTMPSAWKPFSQVNYYNRNCTLSRRLSFLIYPLTLQGLWKHKLQRSFTYNPVFSCPSAAMSIPF